MTETASSQPAPSVGLVLDPVFLRHDPGPGHPEQIARYRAITKALEAGALVEKCRRITPRAATNEELSLVHTPSYLKLAEREIEAGARQLSTGDTALCEDSLLVASRASGAICEMTRAILKGDLSRGFCALRPPGHHATPDTGMGFCIFNHAALAARYAQRFSEEGKEKIERVAVVDWDVHHGNGTQDIFYEDASVHFFSTHQWPLYPGTGALQETGRGAGEGQTMNRPFPAGSGMVEIGGAFAKEWATAMESFKPQFVVISAGFDSRIDDPLGGFTLTDPDFAELTKIVRQVADRHANGRLVSCLEGGYNINGLASAVVSHLQALLA